MYAIEMLLGKRRGRSAMARSRRCNTAGEMMVEQWKTADMRQVVFNATILLWARCESDAAGDASDEGEMCRTAY